MQLGISSLGHIIEMGSTGNYENLIDLQLNASEVCLDYAEQNKIKLVELVLEPPVMFKDENRRKFIDLVNSYSLKKQIHAPFININLCSHNSRISNASIESYFETVEICSEINVETITIHPGLANFLIDSIRNFNKVQLKRAIHKLLDFSNDRNISICLENMPQKDLIMTDEKNIEDVFTSIDRDDLFLTYDTSHFYTCDGNVKRLWEKYSHIIKNIHIVENFSKETDTHPPLGTGKIDFKEIIKIIRSFNYRGSLIIELSSTNSLHQSINFIKKFL